MSFTYRPKTPNNTKIKFLTEYRDYQNTFNNAGSTTFRDKIKKKSFNRNFKKYKVNPYATFLKTSAPFKYYNNDKEKLLVCYNGGPKKEFRPIINRENLSKFLKNLNKPLIFRKPCGCLTNKNLQKYQCINYPYKWNYDTYCPKQELPQINSNDNNAYTVKLSNPKFDNRTNEKLTSNFKNNFTKKNYRINTESNNYEKNKIGENEEEQNNNEDLHEYKEEENIIERIEEKPYKKSYYNFFNISNIRPRTSFHKRQIFNNCKPFLVDDFKDYGYYE